MSYRKRMIRRDIPEGFRYLTFSCQRRLPLLGKPAIRDAFVRGLARARERCGFSLVAWVVMPEHVHLILTPGDPLWPVAKMVVAIKQPLGQLAIARWRRLGAPILEKLTCANGRVRFWQPGGGFDRNPRDDAELGREIEYIHTNPVRRGLVAAPTDWAWSSARWYAGVREGQIPIDLKRTARGGFAVRRATDLSALGQVMPMTADGDRRH